MTTKIEWVQNQDGGPGETLNLWTGCHNHDGKGNCKGGGFRCYAYRLANGQLRTRYLANKNLAPRTSYPLSDGFDPFYPRFWEERYRKYVPRVASKRHKPRGIFLNDMSDWAGQGIPEAWQEKMFTLINLYPEDRFYLLTKQPQNLPQWSPFPGNCYVGVTIPSEPYFDNGLCGLLNIIATKRFISFEPLLSRIEVSPQLLVGIDWVIIGAQTKPTVYPKIEWVQEIALACTKAHIPLFLKDNLRPILPNRMPFWSPVSWTEIDKGIPIRMTENRLRQELPKCQK